MKLDIFHLVYIATENISNFVLKIYLLICTCYCNYVFLLIFLFAAQTDDKNWREFEGHRVSSEDVPDAFHLHACPVYSA